MNHRLIAVSLVLAGALSAQEVKLYSEFRRVDPFGNIVPADSTGRPREILSPLLARNSHATFHVMVEAPRGEIFRLHIVQNPPKTVLVTVYKEMYEQRDGVWIPDRLLPVSLPYTSHIPDRYHGLQAQTVECFLLDIWVPAYAEPTRIRLDAQVNMGDDWIISPMEVRISDKTVPDTDPSGAALPDITASSDAFILGPLKNYQCGAPEKSQKGETNIRQFIHRNAVEDMTLARSLVKGMGADAVADGILRGLEIGRAEFCSAGEISSPFGPEWYLRGRDFLYRSGLDY